jgi:hypothetical protein
MRVRGVPVSCHVAGAVSCGALRDAVFARCRVCAMPCLRDAVLRCMCGFAACRGAEVPVRWVVVHCPCRMLRVESRACAHGCHSSDSKAACLSGADQRISCIHDKSLRAVRRLWREQEMRRSNRKRDDAMGECNSASSRLRMGCGAAHVPTRTSSS